MFLCRRDALIKSFHIPEDQFHVERKESNTGRNIDICYTVAKSASGSQQKEIVGYIRFNGRKDTKGEGYTGTVEITNRRATLQPRHLEMGGTTKKNRPEQAGAHGEGLKLALLVMMRGEQNHKVRCHSGGFSWGFDFTNLGKLVARVSRMKDARVRKLEDQAQ